MSSEDRSTVLIKDLKNRIAMIKNMVQELLIRVDRREITRWFVEII